MSRESFIRRAFGVPGKTVSHDRSKRQEKELAARVGGRVTLASGALSMKGDVRNVGVMRGEAKTTKHKSFSVTLDMIQKIEDAALPHGEIPAIVVEFHDNGKKVKEVVVVPSYVLEILNGH